jgi:SAM-dependent methyltransferase
VTSPPCRSCGSPLRHTVVDLGQQPLANAYLEPGKEIVETTFPLRARFCETCFLVQVDDVESPSNIFSDYAYFSSVSETWVEHARRFVEAAMTRFGLSRDSLVVEIASNDGYLLSHFVERGVPVVGVEPAANVAAVAVEKGVPTEVAFFGEATAADLVARYRKADLIVANNVLAHVPDLNDFVRGLAALLAPEGTISIEVPHLLHLVREVQFDTIYHEHFSYFSLLAVQATLERHNLRIVDVERLTTHGGSLRIYAVHASSGVPVAPVVGEILAEERSADLDRPDGFTGFAARVAACRESLLAFLIAAKRDGRRVVGYGAAAKGNTFLNYAGVGPDLLEYVVDLSPHKQGRLLPGSHIPVLAPEHLDQDQPDDILILPWNLRAEIMSQLARVREWGGRFVIAIPTIEVVG